MGIIESGANAGAGLVLGPRNRREAKAKAKADREFVGGLDWEPFYASQSAPRMQVSQSPVARSYLQSLLTGNNPDATFSGAPNADAVKQGQQLRKDDMYGTDAQMLAQEAAERERLNSMHVDAPPPLAGVDKFRQETQEVADQRPKQELDGGQKALGALTFGATSRTQKQKNAKAGVAWDKMHPESGSYSGHKLTPEEQAMLTTAVHDPNATPESIDKAWEQTKTWRDVNRPNDDLTALDKLVGAHTFGIFSRKQKNRNKKAQKQWDAKFPDDKG